MERNKRMVCALSVAWVVFLLGCAREPVQDVGGEVTSDVAVQEIIDIVVPTEEVEEQTEVKWHGKTVELAPERAVLPETVEILDVKECLSDFSLNITFVNKGEEEFHFSIDYALDVKIDDKWYEYAPFGSLYSNGYDVDCVLLPGKSKQMNYELWSRSDLPVGEYRITTKEGITGEFEIREAGIYELYALGEYPTRPADEKYESITEKCSDIDYYDNYTGMYVFENGGFHGLFYIVFYEEQRFCYWEGSASSYAGSGRWQIIDDELIMSDNGGLSYSICNYFKIQDNVLVFEEEKSTGFSYASVRDGERFICDRNQWEEAVQKDSEQKLLYVYPPTE